MLRLFVSLAILLIICLFVCDLFDVEFGFSVPITYVLITLLQYISSLLGKLSYFKYAIVLFIFIIVIYFVIKYRLKLLDFNFMNNKFGSLFFKPSFFVYVLFFIYFYHVLSNVMFSNIDDIGYWGTKIDQMLRHDSLYTKDAYVTFGGKGYPPFTHLLEVAFIKLFGDASNTYPLLAMSSFSFSFFLPLFDKYKFNIKDIVKTILTLLFVISLMLCISLNPTNNNPSFVFNSIYVDWLLSFALLYGFYNIYIFDKTKIIHYINIMAAGFVLIFTKQIGMALFLLLIVTFVLKLLLDNELTKDSLIKIAIVVLIPLLIYCSWNSYANNFFSTPSTLSIIPSIHNLSFSPDYGSIIPVGSSFFTSLFNPSSIALVSMFIWFAFNEPIMQCPIELSYFVIIFLCVVTLIIFGIISKQKKAFYIFPIMILLGSIGYALGIMMSYIAIFSDGITMPLFGRYMQTYTYFSFLFTFIIIFNHLNKARYLTIALLIAMVFVNRDSISTIIYNENHQNFREYEREVVGNWIDYEYNFEPILVINQTDRRYYNLLKNLFGEKGVNVTYKQFVEEDILDTFIELLDKNELILIGDYDEIFYKDFWSKISDTIPYNSSLYRIIHGEQISFELVYTWDATEFDK